MKQTKPKPLMTQPERRWKVGEFLGLFNCLGLNCCKFCDSCRRIEFALLEDVLNVFGNNRFIALEEAGKLIQGEPEGVADQPDVKAGAPVLGSVENKVSGALGRKRR